MTQVCRADCCFIAHCGVSERTDEDLRRMIWQELPSVKQYYNDAFPLYDASGYPGKHESLSNKKETYSQENRMKRFLCVEGDNCELRHYLARLARRSRCFSRCIGALRRAVDLFIFAWNRRQRWKRVHPKYPASVRDFITEI